MVDEHVRRISSNIIGCQFDGPKELKSLSRVLERVMMNPEVDLTQVCARAGAQRIIIHTSSSQRHTFET